MKRAAAIIATLALAAALGARAAADIPESVRSLVQKRCAGCHKGKFPPKGLNFEPANLASIVDAPSSEAPGLKIVDSQAPESSYLLKKVRREGGITGKPMPPGKALTAEELQILETWILSLR